MFVIIFYIYGNLFLFKMEAGKLWVIYKLDSMYDLRLEHVDASDGQWHKVTLERHGKEFILKLDGGEGRFYSDTLGPVGGVNEFKPTASETYAGAELTISNGNVGGIAGQDMSDSKSLYTH